MESVRPANGIVTVQLAPDNVVVMLSLDFVKYLRVPDIEEAMLSLEERIRAMHPEVSALFVKPQTRATAARHALDGGRAMRPTSPNPFKVSGQESRNATRKGERAIVKGHAVSEVINGMKLAVLVACAIASCRLDVAWATPSVTALVGGTVVVVDGGPSIPNATVIIDGERIVAVGPAASTAVPAGAKVVPMVGNG